MFTENFQLYDNMKNLFSIALCLISFSCFAAEDEITHGQLKSGLNYYIIKTTDSSVDYYMIQNGGSSNELSNESGLAHFIEHLSFLQSKNFKSGISTFFMRNGIKYNASTYRDKIVYYGVGVDKNSKLLNDSMLLVLHDWCGFIEPDSAYVEQEKKIVLEEWRTKEEQSQGEISMAKVLYNNSKLSVLNGLGNMPELMANSIGKLSDFYKSWMDPSKCAIVIMGDVDVKEYQEKIETIFSDLTRSPNYIERDNVVIPDNDTIQYNLLSSGSRGGGNHIVLSHRIKYTPAKDVETFCKENLYMQLYNTFIKRRITRYSESNRSLIFSCNIMYNDFMNGLRQFYIECMPHSGYDRLAIRQILAYHYDLLNNGLSEDEIDDLITSYKVNFLADKSKFDYLQVAEYSFIRSHPCYTVDKYNEVVSEVVKNFDNKDFAAYCRNNIRQENSAVTVFSGSKGGNVFSKGDFENIISKKDDKCVVIAADKIVFDGNLLTTSTKATTNGSVISMGNGLKIVYVQSKDGAFTVQAYSLGGISSLPINDVLYGKNLPALLSVSGIGGHNAIAVDRYKFRTGVELSFSVNDCYETMEATAPVDSAEELLKLLFLQIEKADFKSEYLANKKALLPKLYQNRAEGEEYRIMLDKELYGVNSRDMKTGDSFVNSLDSAKIKSVFENKFKNASQWLYVISSPLSLNEIQPMIEKYTGNLTATENRDVYKKQRTLKLKKSVTKTIVWNTPNNNGGTDMNYVYTKWMSPSERMNFKVLSYVMKRRLDKEFREVRAAIYGMYMESYISVLPDYTAVININFGSKKEDQEPLATYVEEDLERIAKNGITEEELNVAKSMMAKEVSDDEFKLLIRDSYLTNNLNSAIKAYAVENVNVNTIKNFAAKFKKNAKVVRFVFI